jgi:hypothetical protein
MAVIVRTRIPGEEPVQESTQTLVVNAHGGLLKLRSDFLVGQLFILLNPQNGMEQACRVVRIEQPSPDYFAVAFEFERPNPKFWPVTFPPENWSSALSSVLH